MDQSCRVNSGSDCKKRAFWGALLAREDAPSKSSEFAKSLIVATLHDALLSGLGGNTRSGSSCPCFKRDRSSISASKLRNSLRPERRLTKSGGEFILRGSSYTNFRKALTDFSNMVILVRESSEVGPLGDTARRSVAPESTTLKSRRKKEGMVEAPDSLSRPETRSALAARALKPRDQ